jgi:hypothetical protein
MSHRAQSAIEARCSNAGSSMPGNSYTRSVALAEDVQGSLPPTTATSTCPQYSAQQVAHTHSTTSAPDPDDVHLDASSAWAYACCTIRPAADTPCTLQEAWAESCCQRALHRGQLGSLHINYYEQNLGGTSTAPTHPIHSNVITQNPTAISRIPPACGTGEALIYTVTDTPEQHAPTRQHNL